MNDGIPNYEASERADELINMDEDQRSTVFKAYEQETLTIPWGLSMAFAHQAKLGFHADFTAFKRDVARLITCELRRMAKGRGLRLHVRVDRVMFTEAFKKGLDYARRDRDMEFNAAMTDLESLRDQAQRTIDQLQKMPYVDLGTVLHRIWNELDLVARSVQRRRSE
jgi:hypothetical protein